MALKLLVFLTYPAGVFTGLSMVLWHSRWWGLTLAVAAITCTVVALPRQWWGRLAFVAGVATTVGLAFGRRPEGDWAVGEGVHGWVMLGAVMVATAFAVATLPVRGTSSDHRLHA
ncbi:hypothetical protein [Nocardioides limicola]|uniref:hypothetical protein n=1 Tax=Nocardioides limicola TaxID=2803368 RepID=UPI00193B1794|nr:hypothetical protein [Nocardioides sp. DJM-14]